MPVDKCVARFMNISMKLGGSEVVSKPKILSEAEESSS